MNPSLFFPNLVRQLLPPHKRQPARLALFRAFVGPLQLLMNDFVGWRNNTRMMLGVNSQVKILEGYLRKKYKQPVTIKIVTFSDGLLLIGLQKEGRAMMPLIGLSDENSFAKIPLSGEVRQQFGDADFIVYLPADVDIGLIRAELENYKQALIKYKIIQN